MGAYESRQRDPNEGNEHVEDYYELLGVSEDASADEIKKVSARLV